MEAVDIEATIIALERHSNRLKAIRENAMQLIHKRYDDPVAIEQLASMKQRLERTFQAGIAISEKMVKAIPSLMAHPAGLTGLLEAQTRLGEESDQTMLVLERIDPTLCDPTATYH